MAVVLSVGTEHSQRCATSNGALLPSLMLGTGLGAHKARFYKSKRGQGSKGSSSCQENRSIEKAGETFEEPESEAVFKKTLEAWKTGSPTITTTTGTPTSGSTTIGECTPWHEPYETESNLVTVQAAISIPQVPDSQLAIGFQAAILRLIERNPIPGERMSCFHAVRPPALRMEDYLQRIKTFFASSGACYVLGLCYLERLLEKHSDIKFSPFSCHRLVIVCLVVATKYHDDHTQDNTVFAKIAGLQVAELNALELRLLQLLDWKLSVRPEQYNHYEKLVCRASLHA